MKKHIVDAIVILVLFAGGWWLGGHSKVSNELSSQKQTTHEICVALNNVNHVITKNLRRSKSNLTQLAYYRAHPAEAKQQRREIDRTINDFKPRTC